LVKIINEFAGGESQIKVKTVGQTLVLVGTSYGKGSAKRIEQFAKIFHTSVVNLIKEKQVGLDPGADKMIQVYVHFMEVNNKAMEALGASWTPFGSLDLNGSVGEKITNGDRTKNSIWQLSGFLTNLLPKFQNGRERDMGRQLKVSSVSVKSGEKAEFQSGGEVGYPVVSSSGTTSLSFKKYGISMEVLPIAQGNFITLRIKVQINLPTNLGSAETGSSAAYLNFTNSEVKTVQYCASGDSIALSGLLGQIDRKTFDADPGSSGALFQLFRSKQFEQEKSELVIFITPEILAQAKQANEEIKQKVMQSFESYDPISR
jgi:pilus assembly protein CpaC